MVFVSAESGNEFLALESEVRRRSSRHFVLVEVGRLADDHSAAAGAALLVGGDSGAANFGADQRVEHFADGKAADGEALVVGVVGARVVVVERKRRRRTRGRRPAPTLQ